LRDGNGNWQTAIERWQLTDGSWGGRRGGVWATQLAAPEAARASTLTRAHACARPGLVTHPPTTPFQPSHPRPTLTTHPHHPRTRRGPQAQRRGPPAHLQDQGGDGKVKDRYQHRRPHPAADRVHRAHAAVLRLHRSRLIRPWSEIWDLRSDPRRGFGCCCGWLAPYGDGAGARGSAGLQQRTRRWGAAGRCVGAWRGGRTRERRWCSGGSALLRRRRRRQQRWPVGGRLAHVRPATARTPSPEAFANPASFSPLCTPCTLPVNSSSGKGNPSLASLSNLTVLCWWWWGCT